MVKPSDQEDVCDSNQDLLTNQDIVVLQVFAEYVQNLDKIHEENMGNEKNFFDIMKNAALYAKVGSRHNNTLTSTPKIMVEHDSKPDIPLFSSSESGCKGYGLTQYDSTQQDQRVNDFDNTNDPKNVIININNNSDEIKEPSDIYPQVVCQTKPCHSRNNQTDIFSMKDILMKENLRTGRAHTDVNNTLTSVKKENIVDCEYINPQNQYERHTSS